MPILFFNSPEKPIEKSSRYSIFIVSIAATISVYLMLVATPLRQMENAAEDMAINWISEKVPVSDDIVVVEIRETTLSNFQYRSPLNREFLAKLIETLLAAGAKKIGIDILFDQPTDPYMDRQLKNAISSGVDKIWIARASSQQGLSIRQLEFQRNFLGEYQTASILLTQDRQDGIVRYYLSSEQNVQENIPHIAEALADTKRSEYIGGFERILFQGKNQKELSAFPTYPAEAVPQLPVEWFKDKYVLIGMNLPNIDQFRTPLNSIFHKADVSIPGVQIHSNILNQLLMGIRLSETPPLLKIVLMLAGAFAGSYLFDRSGTILRGFFSILVFSAGLSAVGLLILVVSFTLLPFIATTMSLVVSALITSFIIWQHDRTSKLFFRTAWSQYVSPEVVDSLIADPEKLKIGGQHVDASFIFTDIAGFTSLSERLPVEELSKLLNRYFDEMTKEFRNAGATIDKIVGDAIVGFIGAPLKNENHPDLAVSLALRLETVSSIFQAEAAKLGIEFGKTRIGVNTGTAIIGNFGGSNFFDYTALGDEMNITARLEGANKYFGTSICVSGSTVARAKKHIFRPIGRILLAGKKIPIEAWEPMAYSKAQISPNEDYLNIYAQMENEQEGVFSQLQTLNAAYPSDYLVEFHLKRLQKGQSGVILELGK